MARPKKAQPSGEKKPKLRPALTPEAQESQAIALAMNLAMEQLQNGTASAQVITHFLNLATAKEKLKRENLEEENKLLRAKTESLQASQRDEEFYKKVLDAMNSYSGEEEYDEDEYPFLP